MIAKYLFKTRFRLLSRQFSGLTDNIDNILRDTFKPYYVEVKTDNEVMGENLEKGELFLKVRNI